MLKNAIDRILSLAEPTVQKINGETYSDKPLHRISYIPRAESIDMNTLSSLVDYIKSGKDAFDEMLIHVQSPTLVRMYSALDCEREREYVVNVKAQLPAFPFDRFTGHDEFCIGVQSKFLDDPATDKALLLKFAGTVESGSVAEYGDDGITQKATVKTGLASKSEAIIPNPVRLKPYRTFIEVEQPISSFIFRMKEDRVGGVQCAIFEADGGAWKLAAMESIKAYLIRELEGIEGFTVIC